MTSSSIRPSVSSKTLLICLAIGLATALAVALIFFTEPEAEREGAVKQTAMLVTTEPVEVGSFAPSFRAFGQVTAEREASLAMQVSGRVIARSPEFQPGTRVLKGDTLLALDAQDYTLALEGAQGVLREAQAELEIEMGEQLAAQDDYRRLNRELPTSQKSLVLREPQRKLAEARVASAKALVEAAQLDLSRISLRAPFDGHIITRTVDIGAQLGVGDSAGHLVASERYWVRAQVPTSYLPWLEFPEEGTAADSLPTNVHIRDRSAWPANYMRLGKLATLIKRVSEDVRMAELLVIVDDPLGLKQGASAIPLLLNAFVELHIQGRRINKVARIPRAWLKAGNTVWVNKDNSLTIRTLEVALQDEKYAYVSSGLDAGDHVVTSNLSVVRDGAALRTETP